MALPYLISQLPLRGADQCQPRDKKSPWQPGGNWWGEKGKRLSKWTSSLLFTVTKHVLGNSLWFISLHLLFFVLRGTKKKKKAANVSLCWVSQGAGNEGLSNGDSYFILSIIYGETRFRMGHCANMRDACHKHPPRVISNWRGYKSMVTHVSVSYTGRLMSFSHHKHLQISFH